MIVPVFVIEVRAEAILPAPEMVPELERVPPELIVRVDPKLRPSVTPDGIDRVPELMVS